MAITSLSTHADEGGTYTVCISCTDGDSVANIPLTLNWTLTDSAGTIINSRSAVNIPTPEATESVKLSGNDLATQTGETASEIKRIFTVCGTDSNGDPIRGRCGFLLDNYVALPIA